MQKDAKIYCLPHHSSNKKQWEQITQHLASAIPNGAKLADIMNRINPSYDGVDPKSSDAADAARALGAVLDEHVPETEKKEFFQTSLPYLQKLLLRLPELFPQGSVPLLAAGSSATLDLNQTQVAALVACGFFCLFKGRDSEYNQPNFNRLLTTCFAWAPSRGKLRCILHYFYRLASEPTQHQGIVSFIRRAVPLARPDLIQIMSTSTAEMPLSEFKLIREEQEGGGGIEDAGPAALQMDFANEYIGGGVLGTGCVQEEIRFTVNPECLASLLFTERMHDNECVYIVGAERFAFFTGYAQSFRFTGPFIDQTPVDARGRRQTTIVAFDALAWSSRKSLAEFTRNNVVREILKAYIAFSIPDPYTPGEEKGDTTSSPSSSSSASSSTCPAASPSSSVKLSTSSSAKCDEKVASIFAASRESSSERFAVATGNWGCGAFYGDVALKAVIQWIAASMAGRPVHYYPFRNASALLFNRVAEQLQQQQQHDGKRLSVRQLWLAMDHFLTKEVPRAMEEVGLVPDLVDFLKGCIGKKEEGQEGSYQISTSTAASSASGSSPAAATTTSGTGTGCFAWCQS